MFRKKKKVFSFGQQVRCAQLARRMYNIKEDINEQWEIAKSHGYDRSDFERDEEIKQLREEYKKLNKKHDEILKNPKAPF